jgi:hypothetical protein
MALLGTPGRCSDQKAGSCDGTCDVVSVDSTSKYRETRVVLFLVA